MAVDYSLTVLTERLQIAADAIDAGGENGNLILLDPSGFTLSTLSLARPCGSVVNGMLSFAGMPLVDPAAALSGTAVTALIEDSVGNVVISDLTVNDPSGTSDIYLVPSNIIASGDTIAITSATITGN